QQTTQTSQTLIDSKNTTTTLAATTTTTTTPTLSASSTSLLNYLKTDATARQDFNLLYGTAIQSTGTNNILDINSLNMVTSITTYNQGSYLYAMGITSDLYQALQANSSKLQSFNTK